MEFDDAALEALATRVVTGRGLVVAADVPPDRFQDLVRAVETAVYVSTPDADADVRLVLGAACTTAARAVEQITGALQLPYDASRGWLDFLCAIGDRASALRQHVVVADAAALLRHEDEDRWHELVQALHGGPRCLGGGWNTLVLADHPWSWQDTPFGSATGAQTAAGRGRARR